RMKAILVNSIANHMTTPRWSAPNIFYLRYNFRADAHHRLHPTRSLFQRSAKYPPYKWEPPDPPHLFLRQTIDKKHRRTSMIGQGQQRGDLPWRIEPQQNVRPPRRQFLPQDMP